MIPKLVVDVTSQHPEVKKEQLDFFINIATKLFRDGHVYELRVSDSTRSLLETLYNKNTGGKTHGRFVIPKICSKKF